MSEKIVTYETLNYQPAFEMEPGWRVKQILNVGPTVFGKQTITILITDEPDDRVYKPENVVYGSGSFVPYGDSSTICGAVREGLLCNLDPGHLTRHSWDTEDPRQDELHPSYYQTESGLQPWDVIKAFRLDYWRGNAVAYLLRAGRKPGDRGGNGAIDDIRKAYTFLGERLRQLEEEVNDES